MSKIREASVYAASRTFFLRRDIIMTLFRQSQHRARNPKARLQIRQISAIMPAWKSTHDRVVASRVYENRRAGIHRKGGGAHDGL